MRNRHWTYILVCVTLLSCSKPTPDDPKNSTKVTTFPYTKKQFDWKSIELTINDTERKRLADSVPWLSNMYHDSVYLQEIHALDFNNDGLNDFIYSGPGPSDDWITIININQNGEFKFFSVDGLIVDILVKDKRVQRLFTISVVGTSPGMEGHKITDVEYKDDLPTFKLIFESEKVDWTPFPLESQLDSYGFESIYDTIILRDSPIELDTPYNDFLEIEGNQFGKILKGTKGRVIGKQTDSLKNNWLCALIYSKYKIIDYPLYRSGEFDSTDGISRIIWIRDKGIKRSE